MQVKTYYTLAIIASNDHPSDLIAIQPASDLLKDTEWSEGSQERAAQEIGDLHWIDDAATYYAPDLRAVAFSSSIVGAPGQVFHYNNFHPLLLGLVLERATGRPVAHYLEEKIWKLLGMEAPGSWSLDSEQSGFDKMESGINGQAIDFTKFGWLFLNEGNWNGVQLIPAEWVDESTRLDTATDPAPEYQYFWWVNAKVTGKHNYYAAGKHGQYIYIVPEQNLIFVRFGRTDPYRHWDELFEGLTERIASQDQ
jgi:CubicO group peptidase (beta-lactamase class C family)